MTLAAGQHVLGVAFALQSGSLLMVLALGKLSDAWFALTLVFSYFTWGEVFSLFPSIVGDYYGTRHATSNYGVMYSAKGVASIIGGGLSAMLYERFRTWSAAFYGSATLALLAAVAAFAIRPPAALPGTAPAGVPAAVK